MNGKEGGRTEREWGELWLIPSLFTAREVVWVQRTEVFYCQNEEGKYLVLQVSDGVQQYHLHLSLLCHTPFLPIYSHAAIGNYLITHDWNELSLLNVGTLRSLLLPSDLLGYWFGVLHYRPGCILTVLNLINPMFDPFCFICISCAAWWLAAGINGDESYPWWKVTVASQPESCKQYRGKYYPK